jgi:hypothetical protein
MVEITPTRAEVIAFGGIAENAIAGLRSSGRLQAQANADATQLERAMMIAQRRDELQGQGTSLPKKFSLLAFSDDEIIDKADSLGVSFGSSRQSKVTAAKLIKDNEINRSFNNFK